MAKKRFKEKKYMNASGGICPYCKNIDVRAHGQVELDGMSGYQAVTCDYCGSEWTDIYTLTGAEEVINNT